MNPKINLDKITQPVLPGNQFLVGIQGERIVILKPPLGRLTKAEAVNLAYWLAMLTDCVDDPYDLSVEEAVARERKACADIADSWGADGSGIANAIRERDENSPSG